MRFENTTLYTEGRRAMEDPGIVALYWQRNEDAIVRTREKYGRLLFLVAHNLLSIKEDAEECVNDTYLAAWNSMPVQRPQKLQAWLSRVIRNIAVDRWRKNHAVKRYQEMEILLEELEECVPAPGGVEESLEAAELAELIDGWLRGLPESDRIIFIRRYFNGESLGSLARENHMLPAALAQKMYKLRGLLKAELEGRGISL